MNDSQLELSIVIPCLNEEDTVGLCIDKAFSNLKKLNISGEVILSDNGSSDKSVLIAKTKGAKIVNVQNRGYGAAIKAGIEKSKGVKCAKMIKKFMQRVKNYEKEKN